MHRIGTTDVSFRRLERFLSYFLSRRQISRDVLFYRMRICDLGEKLIKVENKVRNNYA